MYNNYLFVCPLGVTCYVIIFKEPLFGEVLNQTCLAKLLQSILISRLPTAKRSIDASCLAATSSPTGHRPVVSCGRQHVWPSPSRRRFSRAVSRSEWRRPVSVSMGSPALWSIAILVESRSGSMAHLADITRRFSPVKMWLSAYWRSLFLVGLG